jgi:hypothetical protein
MTLKAILALVLALLTHDILSAAQIGESEPRYYSLFYNVRLMPLDHEARISIELKQEAAFVRAIKLSIDPERHRNFGGDGEIEKIPEGIRWLPPKNGGRLNYTFRVDHRRDNQSYDSRLTERWALFRGDDLIPPARVRTLKGAESRAYLQLQLPAKWSAALPYPRTAEGTYAIDQPKRRFDRPTGWMVAAERLGILRERIAGMQVAIASPVGQGLHRQDILALLRWTLPVSQNIFKMLPDRLLVVGAGDPLWRGGLSGPRSLFIHADRPLITAKGTSPLLHEIIHTVMQARSGRGGDWIIEGLAELYSLELLVRSGTISHERYTKTLAKLEQRGQGVTKLRLRSSSGAVTAHAVSILHKLDQQIREKTLDKVSLDDVLQAMAAAPRAWTTTRFRQLCERIAGIGLEAFFEQWAPKPS